MELIVAGYVMVCDRRALTNLLAHRRKVLGQLQGVSGINPQNAVKAIQEELVMIEAGLEDSSHRPAHRLTTSGPSEIAGLAGSSRVVTGWKPISATLLVSALPTGRGDTHGQEEPAPER